MVPYSMRDVYFRRDIHFHLGIYAEGRQARQVSVQLSEGYPPQSQQLWARDARETVKFPIPSREHRLPLIHFQR